MNDRLAIAGNWTFAIFGAFFVCTAAVLAYGAWSRRSHYDWGEYVTGAIGTALAGAAFLTMRWVVFG